MCLKCKSDFSKHRANKPRCWLASEMAQRTGKQTGFTKTVLSTYWRPDTAPNCAQDLQKGLPGYVGCERNVMDLHLCGFCAETSICIKAAIRISLAKAMPHSQSLPPHYQSCIERWVPPHSSIPEMDLRLILKGGFLFWDANPAKLGISSVR